jgi:hypothetical protein
LTTVDGEGYLDAVEKSGPSTVVIVYIYDDMVSLSCHARVMKDQANDDHSRTFLR